jgi:hypothetical protein
MHYAFDMWKAREYPGVDSSVMPMTRSTKKAKACWQRINRQHPRLFAHWAWVRGSWWTG